MEGRLDDALRTLGVPADSDPRAVTSAYRRLARQTHPDVSPGAEAAQRFATVAAAYRLVSQAPRPRPAAASPTRAAEPVAHPVVAHGLLLTDPPLGVPRRSPPPIVPGPVRISSASRRGTRDG